MGFGEASGNSITAWSVLDENRDGNRLLLATSFLHEMIAEFSCVFHDPVDHCLKAKVSTGFLGLDPFVPLDFSGLAIEVFFEIHSCTIMAAPVERPIALILSQSYHTALRACCQDACPNASPVQTGAVDYVLRNVL
jgi:hypothetical protein